MATIYSQANPIIYKDINFAYGLDPNNPDISVYNIKAIIVKIINIVFTPIGSRHFEPEFGSIFPDIVFSNITEKNAYFYLLNIESAIERWLPIVTLDLAESSVQGSDAQSSYIINLKFYIAGISNPQTLTLSY
jgi:phage baseplate assembly protein W